MTNHFSFYRYVAGTILPVAVLTVAVLLSASAYAAGPGTDFRLLGTSAQFSGAGQSSGHSWLNEVRTVSSSETQGCAEGCSGYESGVCRSPGTLFRWSCAPCVTGGPDLDAPLVTDRPDFTEASSTVGRGVAQLEIGYTYIHDDGAIDTDTRSYPESLLRYGILADWLELRVAWNYAEEESGGTTTSGLEDLYLGFKIGLTPQEGLRPEMALIPQMTVPTGASAFTTNEVLPGANWIYGWEINDWLSTAGSTQFNRAVDDVTGSAYTEWAQSWTVAYGLGDRLGAYTEWFALFPHSSDTASVEHYVNGGFTYLITDDLQWDIRVGRGLNGAADDYFVGSGLSIRYK